MKKREGKILWPEYFDATKPRGKARRVPKALAVEKPRIDELVAAAKAAGYTEVIVEKEARHPAFWFEESGRLIVKTNEKKSVVIRKVAEALVKIRRESKKGAR